MTDSTSDQSQFVWASRPPSRGGWQPTIVLALALGLLLLAAFLINLNLRQLRDSFGWVSHTDEVLLQTADMQEAFLIAGLNARAYMLTGNAHTRDRYVNARRSVEKEESELLKLVSDNPDRVRELQNLHLLLVPRLRSLDRMVEIGPAGQEEVVALMNDPNYEKQGLTIGRAVADFRAGELNLLKQRQQQANSDATFSQILAIATAIIALGTGALGLFLLQRQRTRHHIEQLQSEVMHVSRLNTMGQTAAMLAHEINQPLAATNNYLNSLRRMLSLPVPQPPEKLAEILQKTIAQVQRAGDIVRRLRNFVEKQDVERVAEPPWKLVSEAVALMSTLEESIALDVRVPHDLPLVLVDKVQVQQVLINLMRNALEAMAQRPRRALTIWASMTDKNMLEICVQDTGPGLPKEVAAKLFQPFTSTKKNGMGVGLSICQTIVTGHGGRIWAESNPAGGTVFRFTLPAADARAVA